MQFLWRFSRDHKYIGSVNHVQFNTIVIVLVTTVVYTPFDEHIL